MAQRLLEELVGAHSSMRFIYKRLRAQMRKSQRPAKEALTQMLSLRHNT